MFSLEKVKINIEMKYLQRNLSIDLKSKNSLGEYSERVR